MSWVLAAGYTLAYALPHGYALALWLLAGIVLLACC
jgi:hypothetical protein